MFIPVSNKSIYIWKQRTEVSIPLGKCQWHFIKSNKNWNSTFQENRNYRENLGETNSLAEILI